jgi:hypothetical protein
MIIVALCAAGCSNDKANTSFEPSPKKQNVPVRPVVLSAEPGTVTRQRAVKAWDDFVGNAKDRMKTTKSA